MEIINGVLMSIVDSDMIDGKVIVPEGVVEIGRHAFENENIESVELPKTLKKISHFAFSDCQKLKSITIPDSVEIIENGVFENCFALESVVLPKNLKIINNSLFNMCLQLKEITIPESVYLIKDEAFHQCRKLKSIVIPGSVETIGEGAFQNCSELNDVVLNEGVVTIKSNVFRACENLKEIKLPNTLKSIGEYTFFECKGLKKIELPVSVNYLGKKIFMNCINLKEVKIANGIKYLSPYMFGNCWNLSNVELPDSVETIYENAFFHSGLENIKIPKTLKVLNEGAFNGCEKLKSIQLPDNITKVPSLIFGGCTALERIALSKQTKSLEYLSFYDCKNLKEIKIPSGIKYINLNAFSNCNFAYLTITKDNEFVYSCEDKNIDDAKYKFLKDDDSNNFYNVNYLKNFVTINDWKKEKKVKFVAPSYTMRYFPHSEIANYYKNNNCARFGKIVKTLGFDKLELQKVKALVSLLNAYYIIGGFSPNQGVSEKASEYLMKYVVEYSEGKDSSDMANDLIRTFYPISLKPFNEMFAKFFIKYYKDNKKTMSTFIASAYEKFESLQKMFPYMGVKGNERRSLFTPDFVYEHINSEIYSNIEKGNEKLAQLVSEYGYGQIAFDKMQDAYNQAKEIKKDFVIMLDKSQNTSDAVSFRILEKDDPFGFVLGNLTNCCQKIAGQGESCVVDGYKNKNAGFLVFEETVKDESGKPTGEVKLLGEAYIWYDEQTKTVCYDNIEVPKIVLQEIKEGKNKNVNMEQLLKAVEDSAVAIMKEMNKNGYEVKRVTVGEGFNSIRKELSQRYKAEKNPIAQHRGYLGYSDAKDCQFIIKEYDDLTEDIKKEILSSAKQIKQKIENLKKDSDLEQTL